MKAKIINIKGKTDSPSCVKGALESMGYLVKEAPCEKETGKAGSTAYPPYEECDLLVRDDEDRCWCALSGHRLLRKQQR